MPDTAEIVITNMREVPLAPTTEDLETELAACEAVLARPRLTRAAASIYESRRNTLAWVLGRETLIGQS